MTNLLSNESKNIDKEAIFRDFSAKFVSTIAASGTESSGNVGGTRDGWLLIEAIKQFDKDWNKTYFYYMEALELQDPKKLIEKLYGKVRMFRDSQNKLRVCVVKNESNSEILNLIDSGISRRARKRGPVRPRFAFSDFSNHRISPIYQQPIMLQPWNFSHFCSSILNYKSPKPVRLIDLDFSEKRELSQENFGSFIFIFLKIN
ncbi:hypothetical protein Mgra_00005881 [Meloidogyne graminicola]|uniref:Uncharacterized protein n=1 Tax=Meloidogyne graminicola TaxID=189291 RepID=A0A8S9ZNF4_9BILA|nr:hypothetical protein Mgra_00005881 [Meloidogyne graminicola]